MTPASVFGMIFNIQHYSVHDGPGIRTLVFLKGCPLSCRWCSNPESQVKAPELAFNATRCLTLSKCPRCLKGCAFGALQRGQDQLPHIDRRMCGKCPHKCAANCLSQALSVYGKSMCVRDIIAKVEEDAVFYQRSGGGITLSGGEPLFQPEFAIALLQMAKTHRLSTAMETSGFACWDVLEAALEQLDSVIFDIKHLDPKLHASWTGCDNALILENFGKMIAAFPYKNILIRTPVIPGFSDEPSAIEPILDLLRPHENIRYELLPYHRLGTQKYGFLGKSYTIGDISLDTGRFKTLLKLAQNALGQRMAHVTKPQSANSALQNQY